MPLKTGLALSILIALLSGGGYWLSLRQTALNPELTITPINGQSLKLHDLQGKPALITFWATDCRSCIEEIPQLIDLHQRYSMQGLTVIAVAMYYDPPNRVLTLATDRQLPYAVALDPERTLARAFDNVQMTPTTFLLNAEGSIAWKRLGRFDQPALQQTIEAMLQATPL